MLTLRLNPGLDPAPFARAFAETKCVQVPDLFEDEVAAALEKVLLSLPWRLVLQNDQHENIFLTQEQLRTIPPQEIQRMLARQKARAANSSAFIYFTYPMIEAIQQRWDPNHPIHQLTQFLNSPEFIAFAKELIAYPGLTKIDAQASNYSAGHYLTRHIDDGLKKERRAAYTIGFSRGWQPDWGGLLMFLDENLDVSRALTPRFNTLTVFDGLKLHSVSSVSQFAPNPRLSIAGWFRDDPIPR